MRTMTTGVALLFLTACGGVTDNKPENPIDMTVDAEETKDKVKDAVVDRLDCSGMVSEETRNLVTDAVDRASLGDDLTLAPPEVARLIGAVVASTDSTALLVGNIGAIAQLGHLPAAHAAQWDTLSCDGGESDSCVDALTTSEQGTYESTVLCEAGEPTGVRVGFEEQCSLFVTENSGAVTLRRADAAYLFEDFGIGSVRQVNGALTASFDQGATATYTVSEGDGLSIASNAGKSCEERLTLSRLVAEQSEGLTAIDIDAERLSDGKTFSFSTPEGPARFTEATSCVCPDPGSVLDVRWQGFLKGQGDANLRLTYYGAEGGERCAEVGVEILSWPQQCDGESTDCGKGAMQELLGPLFSATCVAR